MLSPTHAHTHTHMRAHNPLTTFHTTHHRTPPTGRLKKDPDCEKDGKENGDAHLIKNIGGRHNYDTGFPLVALAMSDVVVKTMCAGRERERERETM